VEVVDECVTGWGEEEEKKEKKRRESGDVM
jgi:hypothetical protein